MTKTCSINKRRAIELLQEGKRVEEVASQLGLASSTVFKWKKSLLTEGAQGVLKPAVDRRFSLPGGLNPDTTERLIRAIAETKPELSSDGLVELLMRYGHAVEPRTMRKILSRLGIGRKSTRVSLAANQIFEDRCDNDELLSRIIPNTAQSAAPKGYQKGVVLVQGRVWLPPSWGRSDLAFELIIDTYDQRIFAVACNRDDREKAIELADEAIKHFRLRGYQPKKVFTARQPQYCRSSPGRDYHAHLEMFGAEHVPFASGTKKRDFYIDHAWKAVRSEFLQHKRDWLASEEFNIDELDDQLDEYLRERHPGDMSEFST